jgi:hypothetical protein
VDDPGQPAGEDRDRAQRSADRDRIGPIGAGEGRGFAPGQASQEETGGLRLRGAPRDAHHHGRHWARGGPLRKALGNEDADTWGHWTPHDLRRTCRTGLAAEGIGDTVAEAVVGHTRKGIIGVYDRHKYDSEKRAALETWERRLLRIVGDGTQAKADATPIIAAGVSAQ